MRLTTLSGFLLAAALVLSGCATGGDTVADPAVPETVASMEPAASGTMAPDDGSATVTPVDEGTTDAPVADIFSFAGETLDGGSFDGAQLAGKPTVLWFWAPWCPTCRAQVDGVEAVAAEYEGKINVVGVGGLSDAAAIRDFAQGVAGPTHLVDEEGSVWRHFGITAQSTYVLLDASGMVVKDGYLDNTALEEAVAGLAG